MVDKNSTKILIVDDEEIVRMALSAFFEDRGYSTITASSGEEAIDLLKQNTDISICTIDMRLPGMDGNTLIKVLYNIDPEQKYLIITGSSDYVLTDELKELGIYETEVFIKPIINMNVLDIAIHRLINKG